MKKPHHHTPPPKYFSVIYFRKWLIVKWFEEERTKSFIDCQSSAL